ncbi:MAG: hypothetical protein PGN13_03110 [Patulibacter minatonensis]
MSKASAAARHRQIRGYEVDETISVGDSAEDVGMAAVTGAFWLVGGPHTEGDEAVRAAASATRTCGTPRAARARPSTRRS